MVGSQVGIVHAGAGVDAATLAFAPRHGFDLGFGLPLPPTAEPTLSGGALLELVCWAAGVVGEITTDETWLEH